MRILRTKRCEKGPRVALQNLHPRFKSGRRLQSFLTIQNAIITRTYRRVATLARRFKYSAYSRT